MNKESKGDDKKENKYNVRPSQTVHMYNPSVSPLTYSPVIDNFPENTKNQDSGFGKSVAKR
jgi:hypothetical protein